MLLLQLWLFKANTVCTAIMEQDMYITLYPWNATITVVVVYSKHNALVQDKDPEKLTSILKSVLNQVKVRN